MSEKQTNTFKNRDRGFSLLMVENSQDKDVLPEELSGDDECTQQTIVVESNAFSHKKASFFLSSTLLIKTVIGVGILSLPFIYSEMGIIPTVVGFALASILTQFTSVLLLKSKNLSKHGNFSSIMQHLHNNKLYKITVSFIIMSGNFGSCVLELIFFKTTVRKIFEDIIDPQLLDSFITSEYMILLVMAFIQFPLTLLNKIEKLKIFSLIGVLGILCFIFTFIADYITKMSDGATLRTLDLFPNDWYKALATIPNIIFSLTFQSNFFPIYKGLKSSSDKKMLNVVLFGVSSCIISYLILGFLGYSITKVEISPNFLETLVFAETNKVIFTLMNGGFLISLCFAFPVIFFSCRSNFILIIQILASKQQIKSQNWREGSGEQITHESGISYKTRSKLVYILQTLILFIMIIVIAMFVNNIQSVFNLLGSISGCGISILLPLYFYVKLIYKKNKEKKTIYFIALVLLFIMSLFSVFTIVALYI